MAQEIVKGGKELLTIPGLNHDVNGGWAFNFRLSSDPNFTDSYFKWRTNPTTGAAYEDRYFPSETHEITNEMLKTKPFYWPFLYDDLYDPNLGSAEAASLDKRYRLLATGIPSESYAIAVNSIPVLNAWNGEQRNYNMPLELTSPDSYWPEADVSENPDDWLHSDFKDVAIQLVHPFYSKIIEISELNTQ